MAEVTYNEWLDWLEQVTFFRCFYNDHRDLVEQVLQGWEVRYYRWRPDSWPPSIVIAQDGERTRFYVAGTANTWQVFPHLRGAIGAKSGDGVEHGWWGHVARGLYENHSDLLPPLQGPGNLRIIGHSFGGAVAQMIGHERAKDGADLERQQVFAIVSPKPYTQSVGVDATDWTLLNSTGDTVPFWPPEQPANLYWSGPDGWFPMATLREQWTFHGRQLWLHAEGDVEDNYLSWNSDLTHWTLTSLGNHSTSHLRDRLIAVARRNRWTLDARANQLLGVFAESERRGVATDRRPVLTSWVPGGPPEPDGNYLFQTSGNSKGVEGMPTAIKCTACFRSKRRGWSESYYYKPASEANPAMADAKAAFNALMKKRVEVGDGFIRYGIHLELDEFRYSRDGGDPETDLQLTHAFKDIAGNPDGNERNVEPAFVGALFRLKAAQNTKRHLLIRPVLDTSYMGPDGLIYNQATLVKQCSKFLNALTAEGVWNLKHIDRAGNPLKVCTGVNIGVLAPGLADLTIAGHGYTSSTVFKITGGGPENATYRGTYRVLQVLDENTVRVNFGKPVLSSPGGFDCRKITYTYSAIAAWEYVRLSHRQTGRPTAEGHGRSSTRR